MATITLFWLAITYTYLYTHTNTHRQRETERDRERDRERQRRDRERQRETESYTHTDFNVAIFGKIGKLKTRAIVTNLTHAKFKFFSETSNLRKLLGKLREIN